MGEGDLQRHVYVAVVGDELDGLLEAVEAALEALDRKLECLVGLLLRRQGGVARRDVSTSAVERKEKRARECTRGAAREGM